ncbi:MAG: TonB-dependent receptor, partial [Saprospiraceae bacterium]|nr:TonB-dependent receptor [Saprospiraceae bacterium]
MRNILGILVILFCCITLNAQEQLIVEYAFRVEGVCGMCKDRIENTALENGAETASWDLDSRILTIEVDEMKTSVSSVRHALAMAGHDNGDFITPDEIYRNLHECCKYREMDTHYPDKLVPSMVEGNVYGMDNDGKTFPLIGANILFLGSDGQGTTTNFDGYFKLDNDKGFEKMVVSFIGYNTDTLLLNQAGMMEITLSDGHQIDEVVIKYKKKTTEVSFVKAINVEKITREELCKAACCNLSESFETNPSVDVSFTDAITGSRQIQMLGLAGPYVQITRELMPDVRGMSSIYGLAFTPGPWIEGIQLIKGPGSVTNGFESIAGQINVELKKPEEGELLHVNGYFNEGSRMELNANARHEFSDKLATGVLFHGKQMNHGNDRNEDGFLDMPLEKDLILVNRWKWNLDNGWIGQFGVKGTTIDHKGGSHEHFEGTSEDHENHWRMELKTKRIDTWLKTGVVFPENPNRSIGFQLNAVYHDTESEFGFNKYNNTQKSFFGNFLFQEIFNNPDFSIKSGLSYQYDRIEEFVAKSGAGVFNRTESVPGVFSEFTYDDGEKLSIISGLRMDKHNNYGFFVTPRLHFKYNFAEKSVIRFNAGRGLRTANIFAENIGLFSTGRYIRVEGDDNENPYGLDAEVAWNFGINWTQAISIGQKEIVMGIDLYRSEFVNQVVVDYENVREVRFYNLEGKSYSNSFQIKMDYELIPGLDTRIAYRLFDVKTDYRDGLKSKPLVPRHRAFINMMYTTRNNWAFDMTWNWRGSQRIPDTSANPKA